MWQDACMAKRMFAALDLPQRVTDMLADLDPHLQGLRWLPASQLHLTLCFLAAVPEENELRLIEALAEIRIPRFPLALKGLGVFGRHGHPSVVWVGVADSPELFRLQGRVRDATIAADLEAEMKPFHPHITVGRCRDVSRNALHPFLKRHETIESGSFEVSGFTLFSSKLRPEGPEHVPVIRVGFGSD